MTRGGRAARPSVALSDLARIYVDGNNLLHRRGGVAVGGPPSGVSIRLLLAGMRAALPESLEVILMLDGQPDPGAPSRERIRHGLEVRHAGRSDADSVLVELVSARPFADRARTLVVTDDRALIERVRHAGGRTERLDWLEALVHAAETGMPGPAGGGGPAAGSSISQGRRPAPRAGQGGGSNAGGGRLGPSVGGRSGPRSADAGVSHPQGDQAAKEAGDVDAHRAPWRPGRGATRKRGNPKRGHPDH